MKKTALITTLLLITFLSVTTHAQQALGQVSLSAQANANTICFKVNREANIKYYTLEGSNDSVQFDYVNQIPSLGNTVLPRSYKVDKYNDGYTYYRIKQHNMNGECQYSAILQADKTIEAMPYTLPEKTKSSQFITQN
jgi:hypothetical protein